MNLNKIEHIGIAVKDLESSNKLFSKLFGKPHYKTEAVVSENVLTSFFESALIKLSCYRQLHPKVPSPSSSKRKAKAFIILRLP